MSKRTTALVAQLDHERLFGYRDRMPEERLLSVAVECYAGHRGEQMPRTLILGDRRIAVAEMLDAWLAPDHRYFKLRGDDGNTYLVRHDERSDTWELTMFRETRQRLTRHAPTTKQWHR
jgi:hypothetical protein